MSLCGHLVDSEEPFEHVYISVHTHTCFMCSIVTHNKKYIFGLYPPQSF